GVFTETARLVCTTELPDNTYGASWADYDRDGDLDVVLGNFDGRNCVYRYDAGEGFTPVWIADETQNTRDVAWGGWEIGSEYLPYFAVANADEPNAVYRFEAGNFDLWWTDFQDATTNAVAWGDYDNDGDPDLAVGNFGQENYVYRNDQTTLTAVFSTTATSYTRDVVWGDVDNDGDLDLAVGNGRTTGLIDRDQIYCNSGAPFYDLTLCWTSQEQYPTYAVDLGDYDGDGDLDLVASSESDGFTRIYVNENGGIQTFASWSVSDESASSRDVVFADWDGDGDLELSIGYFSTSRPNVIYNNINGNLETTSFGPEVSDTRSIAWGDYDDDGDLDLVVGNSSAAPNVVYENIDGVMTAVFTTTELANTRAVAWGDFNGDNLLDFTAVNGQNAGGQENHIYCNLGNGDFSLCHIFGDAAGGDFRDNSYSAAWGDFDGDQDLDLAVGNYETTQQNRIYINDGAGAFESVLSFGPASDQTLSLAWADFDQDFDLDLLVGNATGANKLYLNEGGSFGSAFTLPDADAPCSQNTQQIAWGDWDSNGTP
ncbi:MAG: VCBS repeat-containing protein, partial [Anaerolineales bacterium]|nr:VCBS repeat-containing protein [Anaerolineales bacterium]